MATLKKPGKTIELTTSAQIAAWRQRLDVISITHLIYLDRAKNLQT